MNTMDSIAKVMQSTILSDQSGALNLILTEPAKLKDIMFATNPKDYLKRILYLKTLLQKVYPKVEFWSTATSPGEIEQKCFEVCGWFGLASTIEQLRGHTSRKDRETFWCNVIAAAVNSGKELGNEEMFKQMDDLMAVIRSSDSDLEEAEPTSPWEKLTFAIMETNEELLGMLNTFEQKEEQPDLQKFRELAPKTEEALINFLSLHYPTGKVQTNDTRPETGSKELISSLKSLNDELRQGVAAQKGVKSVFVEAAISSLNDSSV